MRIEDCWKRLVCCDVQFNSRAYLYLFLGGFDSSIYTRDLLVYCSVWYRVCLYRIIIDGPIGFYGAAET